MNTNTTPKVTEPELNFIVNANWMKLADFDTISSNVVGGATIIEFSQDGAVIGCIKVQKNPRIGRTVSLERYINDANGYILLDDAGSELFLD